MRLIEYLFTKVVFLLFFGILGAHAISDTEGTNPLLGETGETILFIWLGIFVGNMLHSVYWKVSDGL